MINKKAIIGTVLIFTLVFPIGCSIESKQETNVIANEQDNKQQNSIMDEFNSLIANNSELSEIIKFVDKNISLLSKENAAAVINKFEEAQLNYLPKLEEKFYSDNTIQEKLNKIYSRDFDLSKIDNVEDPELKDLLSEARDMGYKVETAEGMFFPIISYEFYKKYSSYVADDMKTYIDIMAVESNKVPAKDAALVISWDEVLKRALSQEKFISQYPASIKINDVKQLYQKYVSFIFFGLNNTPLFSYDTKVMADEAKNAYLTEVNENYDSTLVESIRVFFDVLEKNDYKLTDEVDNYRKDVYAAMQ